MGHNWPTASRDWTLSEVFVLCTADHSDFPFYGTPSKGLAIVVFKSDEAARQFIQADGMDDVFATFCLSHPDAPPWIENIKGRGVTEIVPEPRLDNTSQIRYLPLSELMNMFDLCIAAGEDSSP
jgi:hypothetical protein